MSGLLDLVVPGSGAVVQVLVTIFNVCVEMKEGQESCKRVHQRLSVIFTELEKMDQKGRRPPSEEVDKFVAVVGESLKYLERYRGQKVVVRLIKHYAMMDELRQLHEDIDHLFKVLDLAAMDSMMDWKQQWEADQRAQQETLALLVNNDNAILQELADARTQREAMMTAQFEREKHSDKQNETILKLLTALTQTVMRTTGGGVEKLLPWFLPRHEVRFDPTPFARGSYATLHRGVLGFDQKVVVKCFLLDEMVAGEEAKQQIEAEIALWHRFNNQNVVRMFGASHVSSPPFIVCEDATNGDLRSFLTIGDNKQHMWRLLYQAALGLEYLHKLKVVHRDLKLNNILVGADGQAKLADFGLSAESSPSDSTVVGGNSKTAVGALRWLAPECLDGNPTPASDVYSFAMCMVEAATGETPFASIDDESVREKLRKGEIPDKPESMSMEQWQLVVAMTALDAKNRVSLPQVLIKLKSLAEEEATRSCSPLTLATVGAIQSNAISRVFGATLSIRSLLEKIVAASDSNKEKLLLQLVRSCLNDDQRVLLYEADGVSILSSLVRNGRTYYTQLFALQCLKWCALSDGKFSMAEFHALRGCVQEVQKGELASFAITLKSGTEQEKDEAVVRCACIASRGTGERREEPTLQQVLFRTGSDTQKLWTTIVDSLLLLLRIGTDDQRLWAAEAVGALATESAAIRSEFVRKEAVDALMPLLLVGTEEQKHRAAYALGGIALDESANEQTARTGAIAPLVALARSGIEQQKKVAIRALGPLIQQCYASHADIKRETSIAPLFALVLVGSDDHKQGATARLVELACVHPAIWKEIIREGGVKPLLSLLETGTEEQQTMAAQVLVNIGNDEQIQTEIGRAEGVAIYVALLRTGTPVKKQFAAGALGNLAINTDIREAIIREGIACSLIGLLQVEDNQPAFALHAVMQLSVEDEFCAQIIRAGGIPTIVGLLQAKPDHFKDMAACVVQNLTRNVAAHVEIERHGGIAQLVLLTQTGTDAQKQCAAAALSNFTTNPKYLALIARDGGISSLIGLLKSGTDGQKHFAGRALANMTLADDIAAEIVAAGGVGPMISLLRTGTEEQKCALVRALVNITSIDENRAQVASEGGIALLLELLSNASDEVKDNAAVALANLSINETIGGEIAHAGGIVPLAALVRNATECQQLHAARAIGFLGRFDSRLIVRIGGIESLVWLLQNGTDGQKTAATGALMFLASSGDVVRIEIDRLGGTPALVKLLRDGLDEQKMVAAGAIGALAASEPVPFAVAREGGVAVLLDLVRAGTDGPKAGALDALGQLACNSVVATEIVQKGGVPILVAILETGDDEQRVYAAFTVANLAVTEDIRDEIVRERVIVSLVKLVRSGSEVHKQIAVAAIRNLANKDSIRAEIVRQGGVGSLAALLTSGTDLQKECTLQALQNLSDSRVVLVDILQSGVVTPLVAILRSGNTEQHGLLSVFC